MQRSEITSIVSMYSSPSGRLLGILEEVQRVEGYLSKDTLKLLSEELGVPLSELYSIATFYSFFNLKSMGRHVITVCMGTACHVRGAATIFEGLKELLGIEEGGTTKDGRFQLTTAGGEFTLTSARCFGACSMAPVIRVDEKIYGYVTLDILPNILKQYGWRGK